LPRRLQRSSVSLKGQSERRKTAILCAVAPPPVSVGVSPSSASLSPSQRVQFTAARLIKVGQGCDCSTSRLAALRTFSTAIATCSRAFRSSLCRNEARKSACDNSSRSLRCSSRTEKRRVGSMLSGLRECPAHISEHESANASAGPLTSNRSFDGQSDGNRPLRTCGRALGFKAKYFACCQLNR
jgi:hypothetical protein